MILVWYMRGYEATFVTICWHDWMLPPAFFYWYTYSDPPAMINDNLPCPPHSHTLATLFLLQTAQIHSPQCAAFTIYLTPGEGTPILGHVREVLQ